MDDFRVAVWVSAVHLHMRCNPAYRKSGLHDGHRLAGGAGAALPLLDIRRRPTHANAVAAVGTTDTAVVPGARPVVAEWERVWHRSDDAGKECCDDDGETHCDC
jgi:hypothetical protein